MPRQPMRYRSHVYGPQYEIAKKAYERDTGVRALRSILEGVLHDLMFQLPEYGEPARSFVITGEMIKQGSANVLLEGEQRDPRRESA